MVEPDEEYVEYVPQPGDFCRFVGHNPVTHIEHHAPCRDGHPTGTLTDARTGAIVKRGVVQPAEHEPPPRGFATPYAQRNQP